MEDRVVPVSSDLSRRRLTYFRERLLRQRRNLLDRARSSEGDMAAPSSHADEAELAAADAALDTSCLIHRADSEAIEEIERALQKIDQGTYGVCEDCGRPITRHRLKAVPAALLCVQCKQQEERADGSSWGTHRGS